MLHSVVLVALLVGLVTGDFDPEVHAKFLSMPKSSFIEYFNAQNYSWKITNYEKRHEMFLSHGHFGKELEEFPLKTHDLEVDPPENFDARDAWPQCETIKEVSDQTTACRSSWLFATAMSASDRTCIQKNLHVRLSVQDFQCLQDHVCLGGSPYDAFMFWYQKGLVTQECQPYNVEELKKGRCVTQCINDEILYEHDKHFAEMVYGVIGDTGIKTELQLDGPMLTTFDVYEDFEDYRTGVYVHTYGHYLGQQSVRVIGFGVEDGVNYWLAVNSWGTHWGDNGFFKIKAYQDAIKFEDYMVTGIPRN